MIKMSPRTILLAASLMLGFAGMAAAHHSNAAYDLDHPKTVEGTVKTPSVLCSPEITLSSTMRRFATAPPAGS
jgi:hypothetical protein